MIDAKELRIGNWIMVAGTGELHPVQININNLRQMLAAPEYGAAIPLTPEILEKCGFEKETLKNEILYTMNPDKGTMVLGEGYFFIVPDIHDFYLDIRNQHEESTGAYVSIKSLHQLQNLYFALTGTELQIEFKTEKV